MPWRRSARLACRLSGPLGRWRPPPHSPTSPNEPASDDGGGLVWVRQGCSGKPCSRRLRRRSASACSTDFMALCRARNLPAATAQATGPLRRTLGFGAAILRDLVRPPSGPPLGVARSDRSVSRTRSAEYSWAVRRSRPPPPRPWIGASLAPSVDAWGLAARRVVTG